MIRGKVEESVPCENEKAHKADKHQQRGYKVAARQGEMSPKTIPSAILRKP